MRFRSRIVEPHYIKKFYLIISTIAKIAKVCLIRLTSDKVYLIACEKNSVTGGPTIWMELDQETFFNEYNIEGVTQEHNEIYLEFGPDKMVKTLSSLKSTTNPARSLKVKLSKKNDVPCLTFEVELAREDNCMLAIHDIPVQVIPRRLWSDYTLPSPPNVHVSLCLSELKTLRHQTERFKSLGNSVQVFARKEGTLSLQMDTDDVTVTTHFKDLRMPMMKERLTLWHQAEGDSWEQNWASVRVDVKRLSQGLQGEQLMPERMVVNIVQQDLLHLVLVHQDWVFQFFLPKTMRG